MLSPLLASVPLFSQTSRRYEVDQLELLDRRVDILKRMF